MKDYLNNSEMKELIILNNVKNLVNHFANGNVMDKKEKGNLKRGSTFIKNALESMLERLGENEAKKFLKKFNSTRVMTVTDSELEVIKKRKYADLHAAYEDNKEYIELCEIAMDMNCKNCCKDWKKCDLHHHFDANEIIPFDENTDLGTCVYAYKKDQDNGRD